jgi:hypothetical protein
MSTLPTHRKSPEELARLREELGVPQPADAVAAPPEPGPQATTPPVAPEAPAVPGPVADPGPPDTAAAPEGRHPRPLGSLRRAEHLAPAPPHAPSAIKLPGHRHTDAELAELRRRSAMAAIAEGGYLPPVPASKPLLALAYVLAIGGAAAPQLTRLYARISESYLAGKAFSEGYHLLLAGCLAALPIAGFIALQRTPSRHHAALIAATAFFALVFSLLHYFPSLKYGT